MGENLTSPWLCPSQEIGRVIATSARAKLVSNWGAKNSFNEYLLGAIYRAISEDLVADSGAWNARLDSAVMPIRNIQGRFGLGQRCTNGDRQARFANLNRDKASKTHTVPIFHMAVPRRMHQERLSVNL